MSGNNDSVDNVTGDSALNFNINNANNYLEMNGFSN